MDKQELTEKQEQAVEELHERGVAFEELVRSRGWELIKAYYQNRIASFTSGLLIADKREIEEFEKERREIIGIRKLLGHIDESINQSRELRKED